MIYVGVDPGKHGAVGVIFDSKGLTYYAAPLSASPQEIYFALRTLLGNYEGRALIEEVHAMPKQGVTSMFTFGKYFGYVIMALTALEFPYDFVSPQKWQKEMGVLTRGQKLTTTEKKKLHRDKAWRLFPKSKPTLVTSDALLISEYLRRQENPKKSN